MSAAGLPTIWELVADGAAALPEPFSRAALINWVSARRPEVGVSSIAGHIQFATANATHTGHNPFADREPLLRRVGRGQYLRYREADEGTPEAAVVRAGRGHECRHEPGHASSVVDFLDGRTRVRQNPGPPRR